jgi:NAD(P)H-hydrate epimerase
MDCGERIMKLFSVAEMKLLENEANQTGLSYEMMMENAGMAIAKEIEIAYSHLQVKIIIGLIGSGNNGGDTLIALSHLSRNNWETVAYIIGKRPVDDPLICRLLENRGKVIHYEDDTEFSEFEQLISKCSVLMDGILGTGFKLPLKDEIAKIFVQIKTKINDTSKTLHIVAIDCPSGIDCDTGEVAPEILTAEMTITMAGMKKGLIKFPGANYTGQIRFGSIGPIEHLKSYKQNNTAVIDSDFVKLFLPKRPLDAHKGTFGTALVVAGSTNFTGAAFLAGMASYRIGTGLVTLAIPEPLHSALAGSFPEATWILLPHKHGFISSNAAGHLERYLSQASAVLIGPGFGLENTTKEFVRIIFSLEQNESGNETLNQNRNVNESGKMINQPLVVDADGLKIITEIADWPKILPSMTVLTPHPGEMAILTGLSVENIQKNRLEIAKEFSEKWGKVIVLKGAYTVIAEPGGQVSVIPVATPALAKAGTGDVLAGLITGLLAQKVNPFPAACCAAWIHANAGLLAEIKYGNSASILARDILAEIPQVLSNIYKM